MGRSSTARERLVEAAAELILRRGPGHVGVAEICGRADVKKGSFYHFFASKQDLTLEIVNAHWRGERAEWTATLDGPGSPLDRLERLFRGTEQVQREAQQRDGCVHGCLLGNLALDLSTEDSAVRERLQEIFDEQITLVEAILAEAVAAGAVERANTGRETARAMIALMEGMVLFAKLTNDPGVLAHLWPQARLLLQQPTTSRQRTDLAQSTLQ